MYINGKFVKSYEFKRINKLNKLLDYNPRNSRIIGKYIDIDLAIESNPKFTGIITQDHSTTYYTLGLENRLSGASYISHTDYMEYYLNGNGIDHTKINSFCKLNELVKIQIKEIVCLTSS
jgi:hypothetical protein